MSDPKISIIVPTYNRELVLTDTLLSIQRQTFEQWECLVIDDGSTDGTKALIEKWSAKDARFRYLLRSEVHRKGASGCRNYGLSQSKGEYVQYLDSDDLLTPSKIESQLTKLENTKELSIATCAWGMFSNVHELEVKKELKSYCSFIPAVAIFEVFGEYDEFMPIHAYLLPKSLIETVGPWNENLGVNDDGEFFCRVLMEAKSICFVPDIAVYYRRSIGDNLSAYSSIEKVKQGVESWQKIELHFQKYFGNKMHPYISNAKDAIFTVVNREIPLAITNHKFFFKEQMRRESLKSKVRRGYWRYLKK